MQFNKVNLSNQGKIETNLKKFRKKCEDVNDDDDDEEEYTFLSFIK